MNKNSPVIGIDLSLTSTGIAIPKEQKVITSKQRGVPRLVYIRNEIMDIISAVPGKPLVIVEGYSFGQRNTHAHSLGELGGVVKVALHEKDITWVSVPPTVRAKFATGKGNASKATVVSAVSARTGIVWDGTGADDKCDAWVLQEMGLAYLGRARYEWPKLNMSALESVDWPD